MIENRARFNNLKNKKGITLTALVVTIILLLLLAGVSISVGKDSIESAKLMSYGTELQSMQYKVNELEQELQRKIKSNNTDEVNRIKNIGQNLQESEQESIAFTGAEVSDTHGYRYYDKNTVEELGFKNYNAEFLVNVEKRKVISLYGIVYRGKTIWTAEQFDGNDQYNVGYEGVESIVTFDIGVQDNGLLVKNIQHTGNVNKSTIYYGQGTNENDVKWKVAKKDTTETSCRIDNIYNDGTWYVKVEDSARNKAIRNANVQTVTFDANGGTVSTTTKKVIVGLEYGNLPIPAREGYTFLGWSPENIFDLDDWINTIAQYQNTKPEKVLFDGEEVWKVYGHINAEGLALQYMKGKFIENTQYTISGDIYDVYGMAGNGNLYAGISLRLYYKNNGNEGLINRSIDNNQSWVHFKKNTAINKTIDSIQHNYGTGSAYSYIKSIRIVQGAEEYANQTTTVTQNKHHTLTAQWQKDE